MNLTMIGDVDFDFGRGGKALFATVDGDVDEASPTGSKPGGSLAFSMGATTYFFLALSSSRVATPSLKR